VKPAPFGYLAPATREQALEALRRYGSDAKVLAGGQSLVPMLAMRLARPAVLVDLNPIGDLAYIKPTRGGLAIGAMTRQASAERDPLVAARLPLLAEALGWIGHPQIRARGTVGGSLAHADPAAELPAVAVALDARFTLASTRGERTVKASEFYTGYLSTALEPDEILAEVRFPPLPSGSGWAFAEVARRHGDFALVGVAVVVQAGADRRVADARLVFTGVGHGPLRIAKAEQVLPGRRADRAAAAEVRRLVEASVDPDADIHASSRYRRYVAGVLAERALLTAASRMRVPA
jgi:carbon-monoxide dehydrogenase medium subunit